MSLMFTKPVLELFCTYTYTSRLKKNIFKLLSFSCSCKNKNKIKNKDIQFIGATSLITGLLRGSPTLLILSTKVTIFPKCI